MCDNCGRSSMAGNSATSGGADQIDLSAQLAEKDAFIREQRDHIIKLKRELDGVIGERDLLLCEVSNLRFELEMIELKRLQDDSNNRGGSAMKCEHSIRIRRSFDDSGGASSSRSSTRSSMYSSVKLDKVRMVCTTTTTKQQCFRTVTVTDRIPALPPSTFPSSLIRKHVTTVSFPQKSDRPQISTALTSSYTEEQTYMQAQSYIQGQNYLTPTFSQGQSYTRTSPNTTYPPVVSTAYNQQQSLHKKGSLRNGDVLKRSRIQQMYELSQDLLDKQIEVLERKYGGVKARNAALTIQRAFRRYTLLKKFAAITAMAKAEKRISRKLPSSTDADNLQNLSTNTVEAEQCPDASFNKSFESNGQEYMNTVPTNRPLPVRSLSLRERRNVNNIPLPRSQSGTNNVCWDGYVSYQNNSRSPHGQHPQHVHCYSPVNQSADSSKHELYNQQLASPLWSARPDGSPVACSNSSGSNISTYSRPRNGSNQSNKKVPPEVPKRTSSISSKSLEPRQHRPNGLNKTAENGSLSSVQSSGSDSSISTDKLICDGSERYSASPVWKRQGHMPEYSEVTPENSYGSISHTSGSAYTLDQPIANPTSYKISETVRKRQYRVGLNLFNKKPERGIYYLIRRGFLENSPQGVARFLISRKGLSKQMIGEYLGNLQSSFSMAVLECFAHELDLSGMQIDVALRKFQAHFRMPGEAQKIERLMEVFSQRYCQCNLDIVARLRSPDTVFVLAFAIIMLNTDLHTPNLKPERRMRMEDFIKNLRGIDDCGDIDSDMLAGIYERIKTNEFKPGSDHVTQVMKVQATIVGKKPNLALPHRRLVCYCRLYEIPDVNKKERPGVHQREVFLFNDLLVITKILSKKKSSVTYTFRNSFPLCGMVVTLFETAYYPYGIKLCQKVDGKLLIIFNARNEHDRYKFAEDLRESVSEMDEMENLRIEAELERQKSNRGNRPGTENRDSGVADVEVCPCPCGQNMSIRAAEETTVEEVIHDAQFKRSALSNSLLDIHDQFAGEKAQRRGSVGSLDSGMSVSFQSTVASNGSRSEKMSTGVYAATKAKGVSYQQSFLGGLFNKRERNASRSEESGPVVKSTEV